METLKIVLSFLLLMTTLTTFAQGYKVIVNVENSTQRISKVVLQDYYLKRNRHWPDGNPIRFFDRESGAIRDLFLKTVMNKTSRQIDKYWIGQKFNIGDSPPIQVSSDSLVVDLVAKFPGGVGYVSQIHVLPKEVKEIEVTAK